MKQRSEKDFPQIAKRAAERKYPFHAVAKRGFEAAYMELLPFVGHKRGCDFLQGMDWVEVGSTSMPVPNTEPPCSCGLSELLGK